MKKDINSILELKKLCFENIIFKRKGFNNANELMYKLDASFAKNDDGIYRVMLIFNGDKKDAYEIEISVVGFFSLNDETIDDSLREDLISRNAIAILMPYLRSEVTILTSQPEVERIDLPIYDVNSMIDNIKEG